MGGLLKTGMVLVLGLGVVPGTGALSARAQTFERDTTITGPRGRSVERKVDITRTPAGVERDITIRRPGGTFQRETFVGRPAGPAIAPHGHGGWGMPARGPVIINRGGGGGIGPVGAGFLGGALGLGAGLLAGSALAQPRPAPVVVQQPVVVAQPAPVVEYVPPVRYQPTAPATVVVDPVAQEIARFQSNHEASRIDAAAHLGRMGDARAVMPLVERLKNDRSTDVRVAVATALGQIGAPNAAVYLERSVIYDKSQDVRNASTAALNRIRQTQAQAATVQYSVAPAQTAQVPSLSPIESVPPPPSPANLPR